VQEDRRLSDRELAELTRLSRGQKTSRRLVERARFVLAAAQGSSVHSLSRSGGHSKNTVRKWRDRFFRRRATEPGRPVQDYLGDDGRDGRPPEFSAEQVVQLMSLATSEPESHGVPHSHWSCRELTRVAVKEGHFEHLSKSHVQRLLSKDELQPHRVRMWLNRPEDPQYDERANTVTRLVCDATQPVATAPGTPTGATGAPANKLDHVVVSFDEKSGMQALERTAPDRPMQPGMPAKLEYEYRRHGTLVLLALMYVNTGRISGYCMEQRTNENTSMSLRVWLGLLLMQGYKRVTVLADQLNTHMSMDVVRSVADLCGLPVPDESELDTRHKRRDWLECKEHQICFQYTPRHASWLNPIEKWFSVLGRRLLRRASFRSTEELAKRVGEFIDYYNLYHARPYRFRRRTYGRRAPAVDANCSPAQGSGI
jgi:transposase-like protein